MALAKEIFHALYRSYCCSYEGAARLAVAHRNDFWIDFVFSANKVGMVVNVFAVELDIYILACAGVEKP